MCGTTSIWSISTVVPRKEFGSVWINVDQFGSNLDQFGSFWTNLDQSRSFDHYINKLPLGGALPLKHSLGIVIGSVGKGFAV